MPGEYPFYFDEIQSVSQLIQGKVKKKFFKKAAYVYSKRKIIKSYFLAFFGELFLILEAFDWSNQLRSS